MAYLDWLAEARKALVLGTDNFIARDFANPAEFLEPGRLLPLLGQLSLPELLGSHHDRYTACAVLGVCTSNPSSLQPHTDPGRSADTRKCHKRGPSTNLHVGDSGFATSVFGVSATSV
jgi:hypothetical protein